jgi:hypothetical protein
MNSIIAAAAPSPLLFVFLWFKRALQDSVREFVSKLKEIAPGIYHGLRNPSQSRRENAQKLLLYVRTEKFAELRDSEVISLGKKIGRLRVYLILTSVLFVVYYSAFLLSSILSR